MTLTGAFITLIVLLPPAQKQIHGTILDFNSNEPLTRVSILIQKTGTGTLSDETGKFRLEITEPGDTLIVTHIGYTPELIPLSQVRDPSDLVIHLKRETTLLKEVTVYSPFWTRTYTAEEQMVDYLKFCTIMEKTHTGLYDYQSKAQWQALKDSSLQLLRYPLSHSEFYQLIALHVGRVRDRHTQHGVTNWWYRQKQNIFPFNIKYIDDRMFVHESLVAELAYPKGTEILRVNGRTPLEMKSMIWPYLPADGHIQTGKMALFNDYFPWYFSLFVEESKRYTITLRTLNGEEITIETPGLMDAFSHLSFQQVQRWKKSALELQIDDDLKTGYFRIEDSHAFRDSLNVYFKRIHSHNIKNLIIDLRGGGGMREEEQVVELYAHLVSKPFKIYDRIEVKSNDHTLFDDDYSFRPYASTRKEIRDKHLALLVKSDSGNYLWKEETYLGEQKPAPNPFRGTVYILIDGRNYSASTDFTSSAAQLDNVYTIGEETGGGYRSYTSGAIFSIVLPNSKIGVKVPTWKSFLAIEENEWQNGRGVLPDYYVPLTLHDFISGRDAVKELAYELINIKARN